MATKRADTPQVPDPTGRGDYAKEQIDEKRRRLREATTVDGTESFPPPGMDKPDGSQVPLDEGAHGEDVTETARQAQRDQGKK